MLLVYRCLSFAVELTFVSVVVEFSVGIGDLVIGLSQISLLFSLYYFQLHVVYYSLETVSL